MIEINGIAQQMSFIMHIPIKISLKKRFKLYLKVNWQFNIIKLRGIIILLQYYIVLLGI